MKKIIMTFIAVILTAGVFALPPQKMSYQAVISDAGNNLVASHAAEMRISILQGSAGGTVVYTETKTPTTNANGLVSSEIGGGIVVTVWKAAGVKHGLRASITDGSESADWSNVNTLIGPTAQSPIDGQANSNAIIGVTSGFQSTNYWSSTEDKDGYSQSIKAACSRNFIDGSMSSTGKGIGYSVRAVRRF